MDPTWLVITSTAVTALGSFIVSILTGIWRSRSRREVRDIAESQSVRAAYEIRRSRIDLARNANLQQSAALADPSIAEEYLRNRLASQRESGAPDGGE